MADARELCTEALGRFARGEVGFAELARGLARLAYLLLVLAPEDFERLLAELRTQRLRGARRFRLSELETPWGVGVTDPGGGFLPCLFTGEEVARDYAAARRLAPPGAPLPLLQRPPAELVALCVERGIAGVVIDPGTAHETVLDGEQLARLVACLGEGAGSPDPR